MTISQVKQKANHQEVESLLIQNLGITIEQVQAVMIAGYTVQAARNYHRTKCMIGLVMWDAMVVALRRILTKSGWCDENLNNLPMIVSKIHKVALFIAPGSYGTGDLKSTLVTRYPKGYSAFLAACQNREFDLFPQELSDALRFPTGYHTWILVYNIGKEYIRAELAMPIMDAPNEKINNWATRIVLPEVLLKDLHAPSGKTPDFYKASTKIKRKQKT